MVIVLGTAPPPRLLERLLKGTLRHSAVRMGLVLGGLAEPAILLISLV